MAGKLVNILSQGWSVLFLCFSNCGSDILPYNCTVAYFVLMSCSVLESDPEFGFEEAKRQLEGIRVTLLKLIFTPVYLLISAIKPFDTLAPFTLTCNLYL